MNKPLMTYLDYGDIMPKQAPQGPRKYVGPVATGYDAKREDSLKWKLEQAIIEGYLADLPEGSWVLDCPVGTGRFLPFYQENKFVVRGLDLSEDMLREAETKIVDKMRVRLGLGDVRDLKNEQQNPKFSVLADKSNDASIMCRLTRWLSPDDCVRAMAELQRVTRDRIIFTARVRNHPHARPYELFQSALNGWHIAKDEGLAGDENYRVIMLRPE